MRKIVLFLFIIVKSHSQESTSNYFFINGQKFSKQTKYVMYDSKEDVKKTTNDKIFFFIQGETFEFLRNKFRVDTCSIRNLKKIKIEKVKGLSDREYLFYKQSLNKIKGKEDKILGPIPITKNHNYFKVIIVEKYENKILKYDVDWTYTGTRGFKVIRK